MHILLGLLGSIITLLILIKRLESTGFRLSDLNPFAWQRRRQWRKRYHDKPLYNLTDPLHVAATLLVATARCDGEMSNEEKQHVFKIFENQLNLSPSQAEEYFKSSAFLLRSEGEITSQVSKIMEPSKDRFSREQSSSLIDLMTEIATISDKPRESHHALIAAVSKELNPDNNTNTWS